MPTDGESALVGAKERNVTHNSTHVTIGTSKLREHKLIEELFHVVLDFRMAHNERAKCRGHVQSTKALRIGGVPGNLLERYIEVAIKSVRTSRGHC
jgi:5-keto 4-deoxyuronate isomerase